MQVSQTSVTLRQHRSIAQPGSAEATGAGRNQIRFPGSSVECCRLAVLPSPVFHSVCSQTLIAARIPPVMPSTRMVRGRTTGASVPKPIPKPPA